MNDAAPKQGDVRLVDIKETNFTTQPCDDVHVGIVEIFNDGMWGRICGRRDDTAMYNVDARVICRQLGFAFGSIIDLRDNSDYADVDYDDPVALVWATEVECTGTEERLADCFFPQAFGTIPRPNQAPDAPPGIANADCRRMDSATLSVGCRRFEIEGAILPLSALLLVTVHFMTHTQMRQTCSQVLF